MTFHILIFGLLKQCIEPKVSYLHYIIADVCTQVIPDVTKENSSS